MPDGLTATFRASTRMRALRRDFNFIARSTFSAIGMLTLGIAGGSAARADTLTIQGSSTFSASILTPNKATIEAMSGQSLKIVGIRSDVGLLRLLARQAEFAIISTSLQQTIELLRPNSPDLPYDKLIAFPVSHIRIAFAVNPSNPVRKIEMRLIRQILSGEVTNWKDVGGEDLQIRVAYVQTGGGTTMSVVRELLGGRVLTPAHPIRVTFGSQVVKVVEQEPRALGIAQLGLLKEHQLPELTTDQAIEQELSLVTLGDPSPAQQAVIDAVRQVAAKLGMPHQ
jgi:phosphate transport system substrate-binding protein